MSAYHSGGSAQEFARPDLQGGDDAERLDRTCVQRVLELNEAHTVAAAYRSVLTVLLNEKTNGRSRSRRGGAGDSPEARQQLHLTDGTSAWQIASCKDELTW